VWQAEQGEQQPVSSMETKGDKCRKQLDQLCFRIKDKLEFAENGELSPLKRQSHEISYFAIFLMGLIFSRIVLKNPLTTPPTIRHLKSIFEEGVCNCYPYHHVRHGPLHSLPMGREWSTE
jgi:hypothetical protein